MNYPHPIIAKEGWSIIVTAFVIALLSSYAGAWLPFWFTYWSIPFWIFLIFSVQFFRDPPREIAGEANSIVSPVDGRVIVIEEADDPWLKRRALKISVFMNVFNVHSCRSPIKSVVKQKWYHAGKFFNAAVAKASFENERCALHLQTDNGQNITCVQIAGLVARRIINHTEENAALEAGDRFGFIRFGSRADLYLPLGTKVNVMLNDKVSASSSVLATLVEGLKND